MRGLLWRFAPSTSATMGAVFLAAACGGGNGGTTHPGGSGGTGGTGATSTTGSSSSGSTTTSSSSGTTTTTTTTNPNGNAAWCAAHASTGGSSSSGGLVFAVDVCKGPARQYQPPAAPVPVSVYVYGINAGTFVASSTKFGLIRQGGDDDSAYNWTNDYSNSGADYCYYQGASTKNANLAGR